MPQVLTCSRDQTIKYWEMSTGYCVKTLTGHTDWVKCLDVSLDGALLASAGHDHAIIVWRLGTGQVFKYFSTTLCPSPPWNQRTQLTTSQRPYPFVSQRLHVLKGHEHVVETLAFGRHPAAGSAGGAAATVFAGTSTAPPKAGGGYGEIKDSSEPAAASVSEALFGYLASGSRDRTVRLWDTATGACLLTFSAHENWVRRWVLWLRKCSPW